ncbi:cnpv019 ankyrin repeat protein [Colletotrichum chrysophilum]|uniref:Cnpv019 ankyrin repeat protein n=1 Tax=Colletotrichum chrysophilum TaxID=1836956 RepID=A0AAD9AYI7_9PEZI|nr:cnpv019 ankyrin repeat protein [Colletotrichum chrysophilum]
MYYSCHRQPRRGNPPTRKYTREAFTAFVQTVLEHDEEEEARLDQLVKRRQTGTDWGQEDEEIMEGMLSRKEERWEAKRLPLRRELEGYFKDLNLPPLPSPLPKSSHWLDTKRPCHHPNMDLRPFLMACEEGSMDEVHRRVSEGLLSPISMQDGLACAAKGNQPDVVQYLLEAGARPHAAVIIHACRLRSFPILELCIQHGYRPNQQIPSDNGSFGVSLTHCLDNEGITRLLLENGADPDLGRFLDNRIFNWGYRAAPPMDRTSGLALDHAVEKGQFNVVKMLLEHGANPQYARPLQRVVRLRHQRLVSYAPADSQGETEDTDLDWRKFMALLIRYGTDVNSVTFGAGTPLTAAVEYQMWDVTEFLLERGADARIKKPVIKLDAFAIAAKNSGFAWESEQAGEYMDYLCKPSTTVEDTDILELPEWVKNNPLTPIIEKVRKRSESSMEE